jgi:hypothetical protein
MLGKAEILIVIIILLLAFYFVIVWGAGKRKDSPASKEIKRYDYNGTFLSEFSCSSCTNLLRPYAIAIDSYSRDIFLLNSGNAEKSYIRFISEPANR